MLGHSISTLVPRSSSTVIVDNRSTLQIHLALDPNASLSRRSQSRGVSHNLGALELGHQLCGSANNVLGFVAKRRGRVPVLLQEASTDHVTSRARSGDDVGRVVGAPSHPVLLHRGDSNHHHLTSCRETSLVFNLAQGSGSQTRGVEQHLVVGSGKRVAEVSHRFSLKSHALGLEVLFERHQNNRTVEVVRQVPHSKLGALGKFVLGQNLEFLQIGLERLNLVFRRLKVPKLGDGQPLKALLGAPRLENRRQTQIRLFVVHQGGRVGARNGTEVASGPGRRVVDGSVAGKVLGGDVDVGVAFFRENVGDVKSGDSGTELAR